MKIRTRLSLWYLTVTFTVVLIFSLGTYAAMRYLLFQTLERERDLIVAAIESSYDPKSKSFPNLSIKPVHINDDLDQFYVEIFDAVERRVYESPLASEFSLSIPLAKERRKQKTVVSRRADEVPVLRGTDKPDIRFHAVSQQLQYNGEPIGWVNMASPAGDIEDAMRDLLRVLVGAALLAGLLVGGASYVLAGKALSPVAAITHKAQQISTRDLSERIDVEHKNDELGELVVVLNDGLDRLEAAFKSQQQFAADAAHELKTPIAILRANWEDELNNPDLPNEFKGKLVGDIETITRLNRIINNLLMLSQTEVTRASAVSTPVQLEALVGEVIGDTAVLAEVKSQELRRGLIQPVTIRGDRDRLYQLAFNLIDNAIKYTPESGTITVSLERQGVHAVLKVQDTGKGIPPADINHIFDRFYRVSKDRSLKTGGSGLGLSICEMIAELHGGSIAVESTPGVGSTFTVKLPVGS